MTNLQELQSQRRKLEKQRYNLIEQMELEIEEWKRTSGWEQRLNDNSVQIHLCDQQVKEFEWEEIKDKVEALKQLGFESRTGHKLYDNEENEPEYEDDDNSDLRWLIVHQSLHPIDYTDGYFLFDKNEERFFNGESDFFVVLGWGRTELMAWQQACKLNRKEAFFLCPNHLDRLTYITQRSQGVKPVANDPSTLYPKHIERLSSFLSDIDKIM